MNIKNLVIAFISYYLLVTASYSGVNLKNGNFYISYSDIVVPGAGKTLNIARTYNSKVVDRGWFGVGWGSEYETKLSVSADGSVVVHENGSGARTRFTPKSKIDPKTAAKRIVDAMRKRSTITAKTEKKLIEKLAKNEELRHAYARKFKVSVNLKKGTTLYSNQRGIQTLKLLGKKGYKRTIKGGRVDYFDKKGRLIKQVFKNGDKVHLVYNKKTGFLEKIKDNHAKQLFFSWYADGHVKNIWSAGDKKTHYKYKNGDLVYSKDIGGTVYNYTYDNNHNLTQVDYADKTKMELKYDPKTQFVTYIKSKSGEVVKYKYESNPKKPENHYWTVVDREATDGKKFNSRYEYEIKTRPDGSKYTYRILTVLNGLRTETIYSECCGLPLKIQRGSDVTNFEYNKDGLMTKKTSSRGEFVKIEYNPKFKKISKVINKKGWTKYSYDKKGNLQKAQSSKGQAVLLIYDSKQRISKMVDKNMKNKKSRTLSFKYNSLNKPVIIKMKGYGKINVSYDNYGEIKKVESKAGHRMALQVTQAFQSLLSIVKPAGVNLNM